MGLIAELYRRLGRTTSFVLLLFEAVLVLLATRRLAGMLSVLSMLSSSELELDEAESLCDNGYNSRNKCDGDAMQGNRVPEEDKSYRSTPYS